MKNSGQEVQGCGVPEVCVKACTDLPLGATSQLWSLGAFPNIIQSSPDSRFEIPIVS